MTMRRSLLVGGVLVALSCIVTLAIASRRIVSEETAFQAPTAGRCEAEQLNRSALLPGTGVAVTPLPGSYDAPPGTQISLLGAPPSAFSSIHVTASQSGSHSGHLVGYSQGDGASFVPTHPFRAGEAVNVSGHINVGSHSHSFAYHFVVATEDTRLFTPAPAKVARDENEMQHFHSRPEIEPPSLAVTATSAATAGGYIFAAPYSGPGPAGPMIFEENGNLIWFDALPGGYASSNLQVQQDGSTPVLTWWQGHITAQGFGQGEEMIYNSSYRQVGRVHAGNGMKADLHDFHIMPQGTALITVFNPIDCNLSAVGGPSGGAVTDTLLQELDLRTGLVRREWHSLDHIRLGDSYSTATHASVAWPFDYFHLNTIDQLASGKTLISARNTWALYELNTQTGQVLTRIGGRHSDVKLGAGAATAFQHDATVLANGAISVFDNGAVPKVHPQSRGLVLAVNPTAKSDTVLAQYEHPTPLSAGSQGNIQALSNGDMFIGWGASPYFTEFNSSGTVITDIHMHGSYQSYRAYRFPWTGAPSEPPAILASAASVSSAPTIYASWNGDTRTASWRLLAGISPKQLNPVATAGKAGFETTLHAPGPAPYVEVQALDSSGAVIGTSRAVKG
ncbi:MAG: arylsulfotransferase family protein [Solirubrobacteraceae bacterium]